jgi:hypothetical protein
MTTKEPAAIPSLREATAILQLLADCKEKLQLYRNGHSGEYIGGVELSALVRRINSATESLVATPAPVPGANRVRLNLKTGVRTVLYTLSAPDHTGDAK